MNACLLCVRLVNTSVFVIVMSNSKVVTLVLVINIRSAFQLQTLV